MPVKYSELKPYQSVSIVLARGADVYEGVKGDHPLYLNNGEVMFKERALQLFNKGIITCAYTVSEDFTQAVLQDAYEESQGGGNGLEYFAKQEDGVKVEFGV